METLPSVVILSTSGQNPHTIVKGILEDDELPEPELGPIGVDCWTWKLNNKYYTASVKLSVISQPDSNLSYILDNGEALIVYCDSSEVNALSSVDDLINPLGDFEPDVQMLVCDFCKPESSAGLSRFEAQKWCIDRGWELIELIKNDRDDTDDELEDEEDDFPESWGFKRIRQALHAHTWSNLTMKESQGHILGSIMNSVSSPNSGFSDSIAYNILDDEGDLSPSAIADVNGYEEETTIDPSCVQADMLGGLVDPTTLEDCLNLASGCGNFEDLFSRFEQLKQTAAGLPTDQRKDYAERVAVAFWNAMGGDEDEIRDLDSEDDGPIF